MKKALIPALALVLSVAFVPAARAGKVRSGRVSPGQAGGLSKAARRLVGTWRVVAFELSGRRTPLPGHMSYAITLHADGTVTFKNFPQVAKLKKARWTVKGKQVIFTVKKKVQKLSYQLRGNEVSVDMPTGPRNKIILQRVAPKPRP